MKPKSHLVSEEGDKRNALVYERVLAPIANMDFICVDPPLSLFDPLKHQIQVMDFENLFYQDLHLALN